MEPWLFVAASESEERLGERLIRLGVPLELVAADRIAMARRGEPYIVTAERAASLQPETITSAGAHLLVIPPWPSTGLLLKYSSIVPLATARRDPIHLDHALAALLSEGDHARQRLTIAYREHLPGLAGKTLGASLGGEIVLLDLPRVSNLHGLFIITTLLIGHPSTQTVADDVVKLLQLIAAWMMSHAEKRMYQEQLEQSAAIFDIEGERLAQLVLLALALHQTENHANTDMIIQTPVSQAKVQLLVERVADILNVPISPDDFLRGWQALKTIGILSPSGAESGDGQQETNMLANWTKAAERINVWQLSPRLRRLRQRVGKVLSSREGPDST